MANQINTSFGFKKHRQPNSRNLPTRKRCHCRCGAFAATLFESPRSHDALIDGYQKTGQLHEVECAARLHVDFVGIHPFVDGRRAAPRVC